MSGLGSLLIHCWLYLFRILSHFHFFGRCVCLSLLFFFFSSRRRHTRSDRDWSSDVCSSDLAAPVAAQLEPRELVPLERERVVSAARRYLGEAPMTIIAFPAPRSAGGPHDFRSEERRVGKECRSRWSPYH